MRNIFLLLIVVLSVAFAEITAKDILTKIDSYRGLTKKFSMDIVLSDYKQEEQKKRLKTIIGLQVYVKDNHSSFIKYTRPPRDKGKVMLMVDENIWFYQKKLRKPLRISQRQRFLGGTSNADIARANFSGDYIPKLKSEETINDKKLITLELNAKDNKVAYGKIILWVSKKDYKPYKGEFYALSGKLLKTAFYKSFTEHPSGEKISEIEIFDAVIKNNVTTIKYSNYSKKSVPDYYFNPDYLPRMK